MRTTALALTGAAVVATGAYTAGSQAGDGTATAASQRSGGDVRPALQISGPRLGAGSLADRLGVSVADLRRALEAVRDDLPRPDVRIDMAAELADALGVDASKVREAFEEVRAKHEAEHHKRREAFAAALAEELNLDASKVEEALGDEVPPGPMLHLHGGPGRLHRHP